jgi:peptide/nickel transport system ATP-binding protein
VQPHRTLLHVKNLRKYFPVRGGLWQTVQAQVKAVDDVSFDVQRGEILGIVGESGCGKSTLARLIQRLIEPDAGTLSFTGQEALSTGPAARRAFYRQVQLVFQDPYASLNPRMNIVDAVAFNARAHGDAPRTARARAWDVLHKMGLHAEQFGRRYPHELPRPARRSPRWGAVRGRWRAICTVKYCPRNL